MTRWKPFSALALTGLVAACGAAAIGQHARPMRMHTATPAQPLVLQPAIRTAGTNVVSVTTSGETRRVTANGIPFGPLELLRYSDDAHSPLMAIRSMRCRASLMVS